MRMKLTISLLAVWCFLVAGYLVNATLGVWINDVNMVLRPLPLVLLLGWLLAEFKLRWAVPPSRRFALFFGLLLFAAGDAVWVMPGQQPMGLLLYFCGFMAYGVWASRGVSADQWRWVLIVFVISGAALMGHWLWPVYDLLREAMVLHLCMVGLVTVLLVICPVLPWWGVAGPLLLALSQAFWAYNEYLIGVPHATLAIMLTYYLGHLITIYGVVEMSVNAEEPTED